MNANYLKTWSGVVRVVCPVTPSQMWTKLSLPPLAKCRWSPDHFSEQIYNYNQLSKKETMVMQTTFN